MATEAYGDYRLRLRESLVLLRIALEQKQVEIVAACSKGSVVLAAAAMERYLNDALRKLCSETKVSEWSKLSPGHKLYLTKQMARRLREVSVPIADGENLPEERRLPPLRKVIEECSAAFNDPSAWTNHAEFGLFRHGKAAADRIHSLLRQFSRADRDPFSQLDDIGWDRSVFLRGLVQLVDARHTVAHALAEGIIPGPKDVQAWIVLSFWFVRRLDRYIVDELAGIR